MKILMKIWRYFFPENKKTTKTRRKMHTKEHYGSHYYLGDLLDKLDATFRHLPKIKKTDPDAYDVYSRVGATVVSGAGIVSPDPEPHVLKSLPSWGCVFVGDHMATTEIVPARFAYFVKVDRPVNVEPSNGVIYRCGFTMDDKGDVFCYSFYLAIEGNEIRALKELTPIMHEVGGKKSKRTQFYRLTWTHSSGLVEKANEFNQTVDELASDIFGLTANMSASRESGMTVTVQKSGKKAVFAIDMERTPYFFKDREKTVNENGATKKIIHVVRAHERKLSGGDTKIIKTHFRGLREFDWNGYHVKVGLAGKHGCSLSGFDVASFDDNRQVKRVTSGDAARAIEKLLA